MNKTPEQNSRDQQKWLSNPENRKKSRKLKLEYNRRIRNGTQKVGKPRITTSPEDFLRGRCHRCEILLKFATKGDENYCGDCLNK